MKRAIWLGILLAGCGGAGQSGLNSPTMPTDMSQSRKAVDQDPRVESKMVTKEASTLKFDFLKVEIAVPAGTVEGTAQVSGKVPIDLKPKPEDNLVNNTLISFSGPKFAKPVELTVQKPKKKGDLFLAEWKEGKWVPTTAALDAKKNVFRLKTSELGTYAVAVKPKPKKGEPKSDPKTTAEAKSLLGKKLIKLPK